MLCEAMSENMSDGYIGLFSELQIEPLRAVIRVLVH
jgi:hypothetical protein